MLKAIAFDLWETLITNTPRATRAHERLRLQRMERILAARGFVTTADSIEEAYRHTWNRCQELYWASDLDVPCRKQIDHFLEALELDPTSFQEPTLAALEQAYAGAAVEVLPSTVDGAGEVVSELKRRGYALGLISNTGRTPGYALRQILEQLGLATSFDAMVFSNEHGECKPQTSIFEALRRALSAEFDEMLFVGDNLYVDVHGAQRCGMLAVHFVPRARGTAVAPAIDHDLQIEPDARIGDLRDLPDLVEAISAQRDFARGQRGRS
jgi:putative hydrolase of the HAD superfamily